jgi:hypothetical protein
MYISWTARKEYRLKDGTTVIGRANYTDAEMIEVRTDAGGFQALKRADIASTHKAKATA